MDADWFSDEYTYLSENELRFLVEGETDSRPAGTLRADIDSKVEDLDEYLANLIQEVALLHAEGYLDRNLTWEDISSYDLDNDHLISPICYHGKDDHIYFGYQMGHLARTLYEGTAPTDSSKMALFGFAAAFLTDHPIEKMYEAADTQSVEPLPHYYIMCSAPDTQWDSDYSTQDVVRLGDSYADLIEETSSRRVDYNVLWFDKVARNRIKGSTVPTKPLQKALIEHFHDNDLNLPTLLDQNGHEAGFQFARFKDSKDLETYDAFAALVEDDIQRINETSPGTLEMRYVLQTIADSDDPNLSVLQELKRRFPKASGKKQQNVARVRNNLLGKKGWKRQFITEGEDRYHLSPYGKFVSTIMFSDDSAHAVCHAHIFDQWEHVTANQDEIEPSLTEAFETVDIPMPDDDDSGEDTDVIDLDGEW